VQPADLDNFTPALNAWLQAQRQAGVLRRRSTSEMYAHMWHALGAWATARGLTPRTMSAGDLQAYLDHRSHDATLSHRYVWRLLTLGQRILAHHARAMGLPDQDACSQLLERRPDIRYANASAQDALPDSLSFDECARMIRRLRRVEFTATHWQDARAATAAALHLGAGLSPGDVRALLIRHLMTSGSARPGLATRLLIPANGNSPAHETPLRPWVLSVVQRWCALRAELAIPGEVLLPSTRSSGKPWSKVSHYQAIRRLLEETGIQASDGGSYRLRHSHALMALRRGTPPAELARHLGVSDPHVMERYQQLLLDHSEMRQN
jgi:site-specific recombinase XerD